MCLLGCTGNPPLPLSSVASTMSKTMSGRDEFSVQRERIALKGDFSFLAVHRFFIFFSLLLYFLSSVVAGSLRKPSVPSDDVNHSFGI